MAPLITSNYSKELTKTRGLPVGSKVLQRFLGVHAIWPPMQP